MTAFLTYWRVLIETARRSQDAGSDLGSLIVDARTLQRRLPGSVTPPQTPPAGAVWDTGPLPEIDFAFPGSDISAMAFLGALAPDFTTYRAGLVRNKGQQQFRSREESENVPWASLFHVNRSGDLLRTFLEHTADIPSPALRSQALAFAMGYVSHMATDIALNPWINVLASAYPRTRTIASLDIHSYILLCLDEYAAEHYFYHPRYAWTGQPWGQYVEPAAQHILNGKTLSAQVLSLFTAAAETTYELTEVQRAALQADQLAGLRRLRYYLAGRGKFRFLTFSAQKRKHRDDPISTTIAANTPERGRVTYEETLGYAMRLSEHLCRRAISYYASLRNKQATAVERNTRRAALIEDLRNWNLDTGYTLDVTFDQEVTLHLIHNWIQFARFWEGDDGRGFRLYTTLTNSTST